MNSQVPLRSLKRNYFFSAVSAVLGIAYPIVTVSYVARVLGPEALGKYYFASSLAAYFLLAAGMGIPVYGNREVARAHDDPKALNRVFSELFLLHGLSNLAILLVYGGVVLSVPDLRAEAGLFGVLALLFAGAAFSCEYLYGGLERQDLMAWRSLVSKLAGLVGVFALVHGPQDYVRFAAVVAFTALLNTALGLGALRHWAGWGVVRLASLRRHLKPVFVIAASSLVINVYVNLDSVLLGFLSNAHEVGLYGAVMKPCRLIIVLVASLTGAAMPRLSRYLLSDAHVARRDLQKKSMELLLLISVPVAAALMAVPYGVVRVLYGPEFLEAAPAFRVAALLLLVNGISAFYVYQVLMPLGKERVILLAAVAGAVMSVSLNLVLVPWAGHAGAAWSAVAAETAALCVMILMARRAGREHVVFSGEGWKYLAGGLAVAAVLLAIPAGAGLVVIAGWSAASAVAYGVTLWVLREPFSRRTAVAALALLPRR